MRINLRLILAVFIVSWGSILVRWIGDVHPLVISFYRLFLSVIVLLPVVLIKSNCQRIVSRRQFLLLALAAFLLALHFAAWISSLQLTTVGRSIFLESTHPVFAVLLSILFLNEKAPRSFTLPLVLGLIGMYLTVHADIGGSQAAITGDALAVFSAFCMAGYLIVARKTRSEIPLLFYLLIVYSLAAFFLFVVILFSKITFTGFSPTTWLLLVGLALGPNLFGHSLLNWASRRMPVYRVNMALLSESVLATLMAVIFLNEIPDLVFLFGAILIIVSIGWVFWGEREINTSTASAE